MDSVTPTEPTLASPRPFLATSRVLQPEGPELPSSHLLALLSDVSENLVPGDLRGSVEEFKCPWHCCMCEQRSSTADFCYHVVLQHSASHLRCVPTPTLSVWDRRRQEAAFLLSQIVCLWGTGEWGGGDKFMGKLQCRVISMLTGMNT